MTLALAAACSTTPGTGTVGSDVCLIFRGIEYSAEQDSAETVKSVREHNARREAYCR